MSFNPAELFAWFVVFLFSTTCHEAGHAWAAMRGGDRTAYAGGQVSLDPFPHIRREPVGMVVAPLLTFVLNGWMIGWASAPYDPHWAARYPLRSALMSLAGPGANLVLALLALATLKILLAFGVFVPPATLAFERLVDVPGAPGQTLLGAAAMVLSILLNLNVLLAVFNLIPLPPLDGAGFLGGISPDRAGSLYAWMREQPLAALVGLVIAWQIFPYLWRPVFWVLLWMLYPDLILG